MAPHGGMSSPKPLLPVFYIPGLHLSPVFPGDCQRSGGASDPCFLQITASALGPEVHEIFCEPFKRWSLFPTALWVS